MIAVRISGGSTRVPENTRSLPSIAASTRSGSTPGSATSTSTSRSVSSTSTGGSQAGARTPGRPAGRTRDAAARRAPASRRPPTTSSEEGDWNSLQPHFDATDLSIAGGKFNALIGTAFCPRYHEAGHGRARPGHPDHVAKPCPDYRGRRDEPGDALRSRHPETAEAARIEEKRPRLRGAKGYHQRWNFYPTGTPRWWRGGHSSEKSDGGNVAVHRPITPQFSPAARRARSGRLRSTRTAP